MANPAEKPIDVHVHIIGNGSSGSGCWIRLSGWNRILARYMLYTLRMPQDALSADFDTLYVERLLEYVRGSSLGAVCILAHEKVYDDGGRLMPGKGSFYVPNEYVLELGRKHPEFLPAVSIHPARPDALDELDKCIAGGAVMLKFLPNCQNIDCSNPSYRPFWKKMADNKLPLLSHTGGELSVQVVNRAYQNPEYLREPLEQGVTVIAAHVASASHPLDREYFPVFADMLKRYPNLYGDNSALNSPFRSKAFLWCREEPIVSRIVHGSDMPIPVSANYVRLRRMITKEEAGALNRFDNILERDLQIKKALKFPPEVFTRGWKLLRLKMIEVQRA